MSKNQKNVGWVSPPGRNPTSNVSAHGDVGLRPLVVSPSNHESVNPTNRGMAGEWREVTLQDAFEINPRREIKRGTVTPFVPMDALPEHSREIARIDAREFTGSGTRFKNGDTLLARITPCLENGKTAYVSGLEDDAVAHGSTEYIVIAEKQNVSDGLFAYYLARSSEFRTFAIGHMEGTSGRQRVPTDAVAKFQFNLPSLAEQKATAHILGTLDDKIELNRRMNATLEAMARALFQSWFVDFDPVRAKLDGRQPAGLDAATAALFPAHFQDSTLGHIPQGWDVVFLDAISTVSSGKRPTGRNDTLTPECNIPLYGGGGRMGYVPTPLYEKPILFTGRVGTLGLIFRVTGSSWPSDNTLIVEPLDGFFDFTYFALQGFDLITLNRGSTQPLLTQTDLKRQQIVRPPENLVRAFARIASPIFEQIDTNEKQSSTLANLRDALLPKLLSGEISVVEATSELEAVT
ncbi:MAG: restriction endonuclease subunit S [Halothiobacillus sp.]